MDNAELQHLAHEELAHARKLSWRELKKITPWGDSFRGFAPSGREVEIERSYLWAGEGEAILCEVVVRCIPDRERCGAEARCVITPEGTA